MPSGPKKRKANKKKKENRPKEGYAYTASSSSLPPHYSHGEDVKQQEAKSSESLNFRVKDCRTSLSADEKERNCLDLSPGDEFRFGSTSRSDDVASAYDSVKPPDSLSRSSAEAVNGSGSGKTVSRVSPVANSIAHVELDHTAGNAAAVPYQFEAQIKANGDRKPTSVDDKVTTSEWGDKVVVYPVGNIATRENDVELSVSYNAAATVDGTEEEKDLVANQPLLASSHYPVEKSSWKSCCGLFEAFSTSTT